MIKVIDNFLTKSYYNNILELVTTTNFEWTYVDNITTPQYLPVLKTPRLDEYGFSHAFWSGGMQMSKHAPFFSAMLCQILDETDCDFIWRGRVDMLTWSKETFVHQAHVDFDFTNTASVFYINESDGDTIFYNIKPKDVPKDTDLTDLEEYKRVSPQPNRLVIFDGDHLHTGSTPTKHKNRILINSNYIKAEYVERANEYGKR